MTYFSPQELDVIERDHAAGLSVQGIIEIFRPLDVRLSEATFRKYVQVGLLPRSRRVGRKGKHQGSQGVYPVTAVRRINLIKKMMGEGMTLEEIRQSFVYYRNGIEELERVLEGVLNGHEQALGGRPLEATLRRNLEREMSEVRRNAKELVARLHLIASKLVSAPLPRAQRTRTDRVAEPEMRRRGA